MKYMKRLIAAGTVSLVTIGGVSAYQFIPREDNTAIVGNAMETVTEESVTKPKEIMTTTEIASNPAPLPASEPIVSTAPTDTTQPTQPAPPSNPYANGTEEQYAYQRRLDSGRAVGQFGSRQAWAYNARQAGLAVDSTPEVGATVSVTQGTGAMWYLGTVEIVNGTAITYSFFKGGQVLIRDGTVNSDSFSYQFIH